MFSTHLPLFKKVKLCALFQMGSVWPVSALCSKSRGLVHLPLLRTSTKVKCSKKQSIGEDLKNIKSPLRLTDGGNGQLTASTTRVNVSLEFAYERVIRNNFDEYLL